METVKMTLYAALAKKKILESQIKNIEKYRLVDAKKKYADTSKDGTAISDVANQIQSGWDKSIAILNNYINIKAAINDANANTYIELAGKKYTIANALVRYKSLSIEEDLYRTMINNYNAISNEVIRTNSKNLSPDAIASYIEKMPGEGKNKDNDFLEKVKKSYIESCELEIYDPKNTKEYAEKRLEEIAYFREEINFKLVEANIKTEIEVELDGKNPMTSSDKLGE